MPVQPIPVRGSRDPWEAFYRPAFEISIATDEELPGLQADQHVDAEVLHDIEAITYVDNVEEADSFTLTVTNWDARKQKMKYFGHATPGGPEFASYFEPPKNFLLRLGYQGNLRKMMVGYVANIETSFPQTGAPTLKVQALDVLSQRLQSKFTWRWENKTDSEIVEDLVRQPNQPQGRPGLGMPVHTHPLDEARHARVAMRNTTVPAFLMERARLHAYSVFRTVVGGEQVLYFGPSEVLPAGPYELEWGKTLLELTPTLKTSGQARKVTVRASNRSGPGRVRAQAELSGNRLNARLHPYLQALGEDKEISDRALRSDAEAQELAKATLRTSLKSLLEVTGSTIGLPDLRAGAVVRITGVDDRFDGRYFVTQTTHTLDSNGYKTSFRARREQSESAPAPAQGSAP